MLFRSDKLQDLLRVSVASAGNDHRLGANEAPPAIVSMFLGDELTEILEAIELGAEYQGREKLQMEIGTTALPPFPRDATDRNRTSPFAFTGNKFEFRMLGSAFSIAGPNIVLNTIVADVLREFADCLEGSENFRFDLAALISSTVRAHKRIVFNGNNYANAWMTEAKKRGLSNLKTTVEALPAFTEAENIAMFERHRVFSETEIRSRCEILLEGYCKTIRIEGLTMVDLVKKDVIPSVLGYQGELAALLAQKQACGDFGCQLERYLLDGLSRRGDCMLRRLEALEAALLAAKAVDESLALAEFYRDEVLRSMAELRIVVDELETLVARRHWSLPTYAQLLGSVN